MDGRLEKHVLERSGRTCGVCLETDTSIHIREHPDPETKIRKGTKEPPRPSVPNGWIEVRKPIVVGDGSGKGLGCITFLSQSSGSFRRVKEAEPGPPSSCFSSFIQLV